MNGVKTNSKELECLLESSHETQPKYRICNPRHWTYRYVIMSMICFVQFAGFYCLESPAGLKVIIIGVMGIDTTHYSLLFSVTCWYNIVLCLFTGVIIDKVIGVRLAYILLISVTLLGQIVLVVGSFFNNFWIVLVGRSFVGIGNEIVNSISLVFRAFWFEHNMSLAISLGMASSRSGGFVALALPSFLYGQLEPYISNPPYRLAAIHMIGVVLLVLALVCCLITVGLDWRGERTLGNRQKMDKSISWRDLRSLSLMFCLYTLIFIIFFPVYFSFGTIGQSFYIFRYNLGLYQASLANALTFGAVILLGPFLGILVDYTGYNGLWAILGTSIMIFTNLWLVVSEQYVFLPFIVSYVMSVAYTINVVSLVPLPVYLVQQNQLSTAFGINKSSYSVAFAIITAVTGVLVDQAGYFAVMLFYSLLTYVTLILLIMAVIIEQGETDRKVNVFGKKRIKP